jgi:hypothetical protein
MSTTLDLRRLAIALAGLVCGMGSALLLLR